MTAAVLYGLLRVFFYQSARGRFKKIKLNLVAGITSGHYKPKIKHSNEQPIAKRVVSGTSLSANGYVFLHKVNSVFHLFHEKKFRRSV